MMYLFRRSISLILVGNLHESLLFPRRAKSRIKTPTQKESLFLEEYVYSKSTFISLFDDGLFLLSAMALAALSVSYQQLGSICEYCLNAQGIAKDEPVQELELSGLTPLAMSILQRRLKMQRCLKMGLFSAMGLSSSVLFNNNWCLWYCDGFCHLTA
jgi:hypothetical protein